MPKGEHRGYRTGSKAKQSAARSENNDAAGCRSESHEIHAKCNVYIAKRARDERAERLDVLVIDRGLFNTREAARTAIIDGAILVNGQKLTKPGLSVSKEAKIELIPGFQTRKYSSRGGFKLEKAINNFAIDVKNRICLDIGASHGGFTDCLLKHGASRVYAIDVGYGQLDWSLRNDTRVVVRERQNARYLSPQVLYGASEAWANFAAIDVSFISLTKILPACTSVLMAPTDEIICLIKPQFEAGRNAVSKGGLVRSQATHKAVIESIINSALALGLHCHGLTYSPLKGPAGNIEYLLYLARRKADKAPEIDKVLAQAHTNLASQECKERL